MATGKTAVTEGSGLNVATNTISEDAVTKHLQRVVQNDSSGAEVLPATQATAAAILAKLIAAPATEVTLASVASLLTTQAGYLDGIEGLIGTTNGKDFATQTTLASILVKVALLVFGAGTSAAAQRVTLASDSPGVTTVGQTTKSASLPVTLASDQEIAHDAVDSGNGVKQAFKASTALSSLTLVSDADRTHGYAGVDGVQIVRTHTNLEDITSGKASITDGSSTSVIAAQGAGIKTYITTVIISNTSATAVEVDIRDGAAGTVKVTFPVPPNTSGIVCNLPVPLPFTANTAVCADPSAAASTVTVTLIGFKSKV